MLYASWNGATDVASWTVLAGSSPGALSAVGTYPDSGFETAIAAPTTARYLRVEAIGANGQVLNASRILDTQPQQSTPPARASSGLQRGRRIARRMRMMRKKRLSK